MTPSEVGRACRSLRRGRPEGDRRTSADKMKRGAGNRAPGGPDGAGGNREAAPDRGPLSGGGPGRQGEAEPSLEVGAPPGPHLPLVAPCVPLSHVAPGAAKRPPPAQVRSVGAGRCGGERSPGCGAVRPGTATGPGRAAGICFRVAGQVMRGHLGTRGSPALVLRGYSVSTTAAPGEGVPRENRQEVFRAACAGNSGAGGFSSPTVAAVSRSPRETLGSRLTATS